MAKFFNYKEEGTDYGYEAIQDFMLSWMLRSSVASEQKLDEKIHHYCKKLVYILIFGEIDANGNFNLECNFENLEKFFVITVKTKRQFRRIDLLAEIKYEINGLSLDIVFNIENKWYSNISKEQLCLYIKNIEEDNIFAQKPIKNFLLACDDTKLNTAIETMCYENKYIVLSLDKIKNMIFGDNNILTENFIFDEFWFNF